MRLAAQCEGSLQLVHMQYESALAMQAGKVHTLHLCFAGLNMGRGGLDMLSAVVTANACPLC